MSIYFVNSIFIIFLFAFFVLASKETENRRVRIQCDRMVWHANCHKCTILLMTVRVMYVRVVVCLHTYILVAYIEWGNEESHMV